MYKIVDYEKKYEEEIVDLWIEICVNEHGYKSWEKELKETHAEIYEKFLVLTHNEKVIGTMAYRPKSEKEKHTAEIKRVYLDKKHRGTGWAQKMFDVLLKDIKKKGYEKVFIGTWNRFYSGIGFYKKNGFELIDITNECHDFEKKLK